MSKAVVERIVVERAYFEDSRPYWGFSLFIEDENVGVGSADDLGECMSMAMEMLSDVEAEVMRSGVKIVKRGIAVAAHKSEAK